MTQDKPSNPFYDSSDPDPFDPRSGTIWGELLPDYQKFPFIAIKVRKPLRGIRKHPKLTPTFKKMWIIAIASLFEEKNILSKKSLDSKVNDARKCLSEAMNFATIKDLESYDIKSENEIILKEFEDFLRRECKEAEN